MGLLKVGSQRMAKALESDSNEKSGLPNEKIGSQHPDVSRNGGVDLHKEPCGPADDKQMQKLLKHCCRVIAAKFEDWQWYAK
jgi:hypothetical protein